jgi:thiamine biosynthesis lipoprotein
MRIVRFIIMASALLAACGPSANDGEFVETRLFAMGTWVDIVIGAHGESADAAAMTAIESMLRAFETDYYAWADGELGRLNESLRQGKPASVTNEMARLLETSRAIAVRSGGRFDPAIGGLVELWGFHSSLIDAAQPSADAIAQWLLNRPSIEQLVIDKDTVSSPNTQLLLDLGGIAKGEIVDRMLAELARRGYTDMLINAGGDLRVAGTRGERSWRVGIQSPRGDGVLGILSVGSGDAVFTSGDYERFFDEQGQRMHHILDPTLGVPATHTQAVTVIADAGALADAAATAVFVAGPTAWREVAATLGVDAVLRVDASGTIEMTEAMRTRIELSEDIDPQIVVGRT